MSVLLADCGCDTVVGTRRVDDAALKCTRGSMNQRTCHSCSNFEGHGHRKGMVADFDSGNKIQNSDPEYQSRHPCLSL